MQRQIWISLVLCAIVLSPVSSAQKSQVNRVPNSQSASSLRGYREAEALLRTKTKVPLRLPTYIPDGDDETPLYVIVQTADVNNYELQLAFTQDCLGGNACHAGYIRGSSKPLPKENRRQFPVTLHGGLNGQFIDFTCGAHCDDAAIYWTDAGHYYSISSKAEKKATLIKMANSALGVSSRR